MPRTQFDRHAQPTRDKPLELLRGRRSAGYSNAELAKAAGVSTTTVCRWLNGSSDDLTLGAVKKLCRTMGIDKQEFFDTVRF